MVMVNGSMFEIAIAKICHEANRAYCNDIGDDPQVPWDEASDAIQQSAVDGVKGILDGDINSPADSHDSWMNNKIAGGWKYGPAKDPENKEHPCIKAYRELPPEQIAKDHIFFNIVRAVMNVLDDRI